MTRPYALAVGRDYLSTTTTHVEMTADVIVHYELAADDRCNVQAGDVIGTLHAAPLFPLPLIAS